MARYKLLFNRAYLKDLKKIPARSQRHIQETLKELSLNPRPEGYKKLHGSANPSLYRVRCGDYRIIYTIDDKVLIVLVIDIGHRKAIYRSLC